MVDEFDQFATPSRITLYILDRDILDKGIKGII